MCCRRADWEVFFRLRLPTSLPYLFSALKIAASTAVVGAIVGEWIGSQVGIGALIIQATYNFDAACSTRPCCAARAFPSRSSSPIRLARAPVRALGTRAAG